MDPETILQEFSQHLHNEGKVKTTSSPTPQTFEASWTGYRRSRWTSKGSSLDSM